MASRPPSRLRQSLRLPGLNLHPAAQPVAAAEPKGRLRRPQGCGCQQARKVETGKPTSADPLGDLAKAKAAESGSADPYDYFVQAGAFRTQADADAQRAKLAMMGWEARVSEREQNGRRSSAFAWGRSPNAMTPPPSKTNWTARAWNLRWCACSVDAAVAHG